VQNIAFANSLKAKALYSYKNTKERLYNGLALYHTRYIAECICGRYIDCKNTRVHVTQNKGLARSSPYWNGKHRAFYAAVQAVSCTAGSFQVT